MEECSYRSFSLLHPSALALWVLLFWLGFYRTPYYRALKHVRAQAEASAPYEVHTIKNQALGVASANPQRHIMGVTIKDPRRYLQLIGMWLEIPGFMFVVLGTTGVRLIRETKEEGSLTTGSFSGFLIAVRQKNTNTIDSLSCH